MKPGAKMRSTDRFTPRRRARTGVLALLAWLSLAAPLHAWEPDSDYGPKGSFGPAELAAINESDLKHCATNPGLVFRGPLVEAGIMKFLYGHFDGRRKLSVWHARWQFLGDSITLDGRGPGSKHGPPSERYLLCMRLAALFPFRENGIDHCLVVTATAGLDH